MVYSWCSVGRDVKWDGVRGWIKHRERVEMDEGHVYSGRGSLSCDVESHLATGSNAVECELDVLGRAERYKVAILVLVLEP